MASSVWSTVQGTVVPSSLTSSTSAASQDPAALLHQQLASALSTVGDAQFWEETISPSAIRTSLATTDPSNANSTPTLLRGMKWLLASISKGRDVSDFYPHVVKLVGAPSLEVRKMVYVYLVQYADHDSTTRELSLLSINSFQRGLADTEPWIRALALRVLTSIRIPDILQIQILGVQTCAKDLSPYVRKCAANALAKLYSRCDVSDQRNMLTEIMIHLLEEDETTMVLTSAIIAFSELCPERLELLHNPYRKICHLLTDMDEWGQVVVLDILARYCRTFFKKPDAWKNGTAEQIDRERRVRRTIDGIAAVDAVLHSSQHNNNNTSNPTTAAGIRNGGTKTSHVSPKKVKRRVVRKGFYSDEEDESTEEEVVETTSPASALRQPNLLLGGGANSHLGIPAIAVSQQGDEDLDLDEDHRLLLRSSLLLLKSRNAAVVMAVCSLHYYCGISSVKIRSAIGKALVRIHRDRREIQFVVLTSIRTLVQQCPSAFGPFLNDFFVKAMDPPFTRIIKLDILTALALEPVAIEAVLKELRTYIRSSDKMFVCSAVRAVGKVVELARIVYDRHGARYGQPDQKRKDANRIALDCLYGLYTLTQASDHIDVVGECAMVMQRIILQLMSDSNIVPVEDPNCVIGLALRRIILLLTRSLSSRNSGVVDIMNHSSNDDAEREPTELEKVALPLGPVATASLIWIFGEWIAPVNSSSPVLKTANINDKIKSKMKSEVIRSIAQSFPDQESCEKEQGVHLASKLLVSGAVSKTSFSVDMDAKLARCCELVLSMGRLDVNPIVRDRARHESLLLDSTIGLKFDREGLDTTVATLTSNQGSILSLDDLNRIFLATKPAPSHLPLDDDDEDITTDGETTTHFRFSTLSSLVGHKAGAAYLPLPKWAEKNSPSSLRDGSSRKSSNPKKETPENNWQVDPTKKAPGFYESSDEEEESSGEDEDEESDGSEEDESEEEDDADDEDDDDDSDGEGQSSSKVAQILPTAAPALNHHAMTNGGVFPSNVTKVSAVSQNNVEESDDEEEDESEDDDDDSSEDDENSSDRIRPTTVSGTKAIVKEENLLGLLGTTNNTPAAPITHNSFSSTTTTNNKSTSIVEDLSGLVMTTPLDVKVPDLEKDSSAWMQLVRSSVSGGLDIQARFLRGPSKEQEARRIGLDPDHVGTVCLQVRMENVKSDSTILRRIRLVQRTMSNVTSSSSSSSSTIFPRKAILPGEVTSLSAGQVVLEMMGLEFATVPDRDGSCIVKLEIKHGTTGGIPIELKLPLAELLRCNTAATQQLLQQSSSTTGSATTIHPFDVAMRRLQGFQRVSTSISFPMSFNNNKNEIILQAIVKHSALIPLSSVESQQQQQQRVDGSKTTTNSNYWTSDHQLRLISSLPTSGDLVFVLVTLPSSDGDATTTTTSTRNDVAATTTTTSSNSGGGGGGMIQLTVCCDNALAVNSLVDVLKRAIQSAIQQATA